MSSCTCVCIVCVCVCVWQARARWNEIILADAHKISVRAYFVRSVSNPSWQLPLVVERPHAHAAQRPQSLPGGGLRTSRAHKHQHRASERRFYTAYTIYPMQNGPQPTHATRMQTFVMPCARARNTLNNLLCKDLKIYSIFAARSHTRVVVYQSGCGCVCVRVGFVSQRHVSSRGQSRVLLPIETVRRRQSPGCRHTVCMRMKGERVENTRGERQKGVYFCTFSG